MTLNPGLERAQGGILRPWERANVQPGRPVATLVPDLLAFEADSTCNPTQRGPLYGLFQGDRIGSTYPLSPPPNLPPGFTYLPTLAAIIQSYPTR